MDPVEDAYVKLESVLGSVNQRLSAALLRDRAFWVRKAQQEFNHFKKEQPKATREELLSQLTPMGGVYDRGNPYTEQEIAFIVQSLTDIKAWRSLDYFCPELKN